MQTPRVFLQAAHLLQKTLRFFGVSGSRVQEIADNVEVIADNAEVSGNRFGVFDKNVEKTANHVKGSGCHAKVFDNFLEKTAKLPKVPGETADKINDTLVCPS